MSEPDIRYVNLDREPAFLLAIAILALPMLVVTIMSFARDLREKYR